MATILSTFGSGGSGLTPGGAAGEPDLASILRDIATDLAAIHVNAGATTVPAAITAADVTAPVQGAIAAAAALSSVQEATVNATDLATAEALANSLKLKYNTLQLDVAAIKGTYDGWVALINENRTLIGLIRTLIQDLKARQAENRTWIAAVDTSLDAVGGATLLTIAG